ncbi:iron hydrogenase small subunit [Falcatimonas sp. MSJ-15]|nr:iron hydrogenase small subunit [Falcatimonas sp. MSJ-15]
MSRLSIITQDKAQVTIESLYKDLERRIVASPPGLCPIDLTCSFIKMCLAQSCGKCVPCRIGLAQLVKLLEKVLSGEAELETIELIRTTAEGIYASADCAIGYEAAKLVLKGLDGFMEDFVQHITKNRCTCNSSQPVPCVALCPAGVDIPGYVALVGEGRYEDAIRLIRKDNPLPVVCAHICEHPCENRCKRGMIDYPVNIRGLKKMAVDNAGEVPIPECAKATGKKVAIIGGGPGGCVNGGGQPINDGKQMAAVRADVLYGLDKVNNLRFSHENPAVLDCYTKYFGEPNSHKAHELLHTDHHGWTVGE